MITAIVEPHYGSSAACVLNLLTVLIESAHGYAAAVHLLSGKEGDIL